MYIYEQINVIDFCKILYLVMNPFIGASDLGKEKGQFCFHDKIVKRIDVFSKNTSRLKIFF